MSDTRELGSIEQLNTVHVHAKPQNQQAEYVGYEENGLDLYFRRISQDALLTAQQEVELAQAIEAGREPMAKLVNDGMRSVFGLPQVFDESEKDLEAIQTAIDARTMFIERNLRLVVSIAKHYIGHGIDLEDLISEGNFGLEHAVYKYDWQKGFRFSTYATWWIRQAITRKLARGQTAVHVPVDWRRQARQYKQTEAELVARGAVPTYEAIGQEIDVSPDRVRAIANQMLVVELDYLDESIRHDSTPGDGSATRGELVADTANNPHDIIEDQEILTKLPGILAEVLNDNKLVEVIVLRFGLDGAGQRTLDEVADIVGCSRGTVANRQRKALRLMGSPKANPYYNYLVAFFE